MPYNFALSKKVNYLKTKIILHKSTKTYFVSRLEDLTLVWHVTDDETVLRKTKTNRNDCINFDSDSIYTYINAVYRSKQTFGKY